MRHILHLVQFIMSMALQQGFYLKYFSDFSGAKISFIVNYSAAKGHRNRFLTTKDFLLKSLLSLLCNK